MTDISTVIVDVERAIAELRAGRGPSRAGTVDLLRRVLDALWDKSAEAPRKDGPALPDEGDDFDRRVNLIDRAISTAVFPILERIVEAGKENRTRLIFAAVLTNRAQLMIAGITEPKVKRKALRLAHATIDGKYATEKEPTL